MYEIKAKSQFSGAHNLRRYKGKCEELHGHNWHVEAVVCAEGLDDIGMVVDFKELKRILNEVLASLDHKHLNKLEYFKSINPTSENIACYIYNKMSEKKSELNIKEITVWETDSSSATYSGLKSERSR